MYFSIAILLLIGIIAYFHWVQGLFSSVISLCCAIIAAMLAFSYYEKIIALVFKGKMADQATALTLVVLFVAGYLILRTIFDNLVPGNVRLPAIVDGIGGAICGAIAGVFAIGTLAVAAQTLPFGPSIAGYTRWNTVESEDKVPGPTGQMIDVNTHDELKGDTFKDEEKSPMFVPVDDWLISFVQRMSDGGSLEGDRPLASVHPAFMDETYFDRLGIQTGAKHVLVSGKTQEAASLVKIFSVQSLPQVDGEIAQIRSRKDLKPLSATAGKAVLIVRVNFTDEGTDADHLVRLSPAAVQLVANRQQYLPVGTAEHGTCYANKPDDFLFITPGKPVDFVFYVDRADLLTKSGTASTEPSAGASKMNDGVSLVIKRGTRLDLSGGDVTTGGFDSPPTSGVFRKKDLPKPA